MMDKKKVHKSIILIDKPKGPTSFDIVERVTKKLGVKKGGHTGTLDPNATGLMVIALGEARKAMPVLMGLDKEYIGIMKLHGEADKKKINDVLKTFVGEITQVPPVKSAVARKPRKRIVHSINVLKIDKRDVTFKVLCQAGTYIRKIASDSGEKLGFGAHLIELRRTKVGPFSIDNAIKLEKLEKIHLDKLGKEFIPIEEALEKIKLPRVVIDKKSIKLVRNGSPVKKSFVIKDAVKVQVDDIVGVYDKAGTIICLAKYLGKNDKVAKTDRVFNFED